MDAHPKKKKKEGKTVHLKSLGVYLQLLWLRKAFVFGADQAWTMAWSRNGMVRHGYGSKPLIS